LRNDLFGNPEKSGAQISPDGAHLIWRMPLNGVTNIFIASRPVDQTLGRPDTAEGLGAVAGLLPQPRRPASWPQ
jgi:hypothetical protein